MKYRDLLRNVEFRNAEPPAAAVTDNTPYVSEIIDMQGFKACTFLIHFGAVADADCSFTTLIEDGDDSGLSDAAAVADEYLHGTEAGVAEDEDADNKVKVIGYHGFKRYVRCTVTPANNSGNVFLSMLAAMHGADSLPVTAND